MPEQLKPCPACGSMRVQLMSSYSPWFTAGTHVLCADCQMQGPIACSQKEEDAIDIHGLEYMAEPTGFEAAAIAAWNSLPRRPDYNDVDCAGCPERRRGYLTWTTEPPKVPGWYWFSACKGHAVCILVCADGKAKYAKYHFTDAELLGGEWAGPIPTPLEPEES